MPFSNIYHASLHNDTLPTTSLQLVSILKISLKQFQSLRELLRKFRSWTLCITGLGNGHIYHIQSLCLYGSRVWKIFLHASKCFSSISSYLKKNWISIACFLYFSSLSGFPVVSGFLVIYSTLLCSSWCEAKGFSLVQMLCASHFTATAVASPLLILVDLVDYWPII